MLLTDNSSIQEVLFFPQMRPETKSTKLVLSDNEKLIFELIQRQKTMLLDELKQQSNLSNKAWDTSIKALTKNSLVKVTKTDEVLMVDLI